MEGKGISSKVMGLKFMQRAADKRKQAEEAAKPKEEANEEHWIAPGGGADGCMVVMEGGGDLPASTSGRLSFKGFKTGPKSAYQGGVVAAEEGDDVAAAGEADVGDEAMAEKLGKKEKKKEGKGGAAVSGGGGGERREKDKEGKRRDEAADGTRKKKKKTSK